MTIPFSKYLNIRDAYGPSFSPDGKKLSFITNITGIPQAWVVHVEGGWPDQITFHSERVSQVYYSPKANHLVFSRDIGGNENAQLYLVNDDGSDERRLTNQDDVMHIWGNWSSDGSQIAYTANQRDRSKFDVHVLNIEDGEARRVWENNDLGFLVVVGFSPDSSKLLVHWMKSSMDRDLLEIDLTTGTARKLTEQEGGVRYQSPAYSSDGKNIFCASDRNRDFMTLTRIDLAELRHHILFETQNEIEYVNTSPDGHWLLWASNVEGAHQLNLMDLQTGLVGQPENLPVG